MPPAAAHDICLSRLSDMPPLLPPSARRLLSHCRQAITIISLRLYITLFSRFFPRQMPFRHSHF
jgi:hypothetical protein